jgi:5'-3' exonuclease
MGIPSYYKRLAQSIKGLVVPHKYGSGFQASALFFDFNCMIYQVIRDPKRRPFPGYGTSDTDQWENEVCHDVVQYTVNVWKEVGKPKLTYLGIDGVVPMAKIRQQRLRRFKSIWTANEERTRGIRAHDENHWDTNAITPGTEFMEKLSRRLSEASKVHGWVFSDANETGEGEQKCMNFWKSSMSVKTPGDIVIYGLDADLILLCLLTRQLLKDKNPVWCLREVTEWEGGEKASSSFMRLSIDKLQQHLENPKIDSLEWTLDYIGAMSFLGNDFVPHGISLKIRDGGHEVVLKCLRDLHNNNQRLIVQQNGQYTYNKEAVLFLCEQWASKEEQKILEFIKMKKQRLNHQDWNTLPSEWAVEEKVLCEYPNQLRSNWEAHMIASWFGEDVEVSSICRQYATGLQWVLDYYTGQENVHKLWMYPWNLPPTWNQWTRWLRTQSSPTLFLQTRRSSPELILPKEQLAMVLPKESWHLLRDNKLKTIPDRIPYYWPKSYQFFSAGKLFLWECEAELPILHLPVLRSIS